MSPLKIGLRVAAFMAIHNAALYLVLNHFVNKCHVPFNIAINIGGPLGLGLLAGVITALTTRRRTISPGPAPH